MTPAPLHLPLLHAVTSDEIVARPDFLDRARRFARAAGARGAIHLRGHRQTGRRLYDLAETLAGLQRETGCWLLVNDRADVALVSGAMGVQLTSRSLSVSDARHVAPGLAIGASVHDVEEGVLAAHAGADWIVAGHVFPTASHPDDPARGPRLVSALARRTRIPIIAIGGIVPRRVPRLRAAGAHGVAAIRGIWDADDAGRAAIDYLTQHDADGPG
ncbi:MAG TPA: thiamine phosphate synthase [Gemmatimonadaceae bacterium]|nr:thiamine phosphate synthase [Gemmatimonadaceae bacterium]